MTTQNDLTKYHQMKGALFREQQKYQQKEYPTLQVCKKDGCLKHYLYGKWVYYKGAINEKLVERNEYCDTHTRSLERRL